MKERAYPVYTVNKHAEGLLVGGHPWVYENDILHAPDTEPENGTLADVVSPKGAYLGTGFVSLHSKIRVRLISRNANDTFDAAFWRRRVEYAWAYRKTVLEPADLTACRVIFGEADQFPGLTVDRFHDILVTQTLSVGMEKLKPVLFPLLAEVLRADGQTIAGIYERNDEALRAKEGLEQNKGWFDLPGETHPASTQTEICENGVFYHVDFENGQKTGFFLDQKYNRRAVARLAAGHTVLDCFTHTGSFALNAAKGGAARVTAADISADAIAMAQRNAERNGLTNMDFLCEDTFELLPRLYFSASYKIARAHFLFALGYEPQKLYFEVRAVYIYRAALFRIESGDKSRLAFCGQVCALRLGYLQRGTAEQSICRRFRRERADFIVHLFCRGGEIYLRVLFFYFCRVI